MPCIGKIIRDRYVYLLLDPSCPGQYKFDGLDDVFDYRPFYVGLGKINRWKDHVREAEKYVHNRLGNKHKIYTIKKILSKGLYPVELIFSKCSLKTSKFIEQILIELIGRDDLDKGPLTNLTDGGDGQLERKHTAEENERNRQSQIKRYKDPNERVKTRELQLIVQNREDVSRKNRESTLLKYQLDDTYRFRATKHFKGVKQTQEHILKRTKLKYVYHIIDPCGEKYVTSNLSLFSKQHFLNGSDMCNLANGKILDYKGWKIVKETII